MLVQPILGNDKNILMKRQYFWYFNEDKLVQCVFSGY